MRNNVPKLHEMDSDKFDPKQLIIELDVWQYFNKPPEFPQNICNSIKFDPKYYFITSGEAIEKTLFMVIDLEEKAAKLADYIKNYMTDILNYTKKDAAKLMKEPKKTPKSLLPHRMYYDYISDCKRIAKSLVLLLKKFRGKNCFLETEWDSHRLLCIAKNPRMKDDIDES